MRTNTVTVGKSISTDSRGVPVLNGGFIISHNNKVTFDILESWGNCTTEVKYPGCARWKGEWSHEQRAFSEYIRYDYGKVPGTIVGIPCDDAMGYPDFKSQNEAKGNQGVSDCNGNFVRHYTLGKEQVHQGGTGTMAQALAEVMQKSLLSMQDQIIIKEYDPNAIVPWEDMSRPKQAWELEDDEEEYEEYGVDPYAVDPYAVDPDAEQDDDELLLSSLRYTSHSRLQIDKERKISPILGSKVT